MQVLTVRYFISLVNTDEFYTCFSLIIKNVSDIKIQAVTVVDNHIWSSHFAMSVPTCMFLFIDINFK